MKFGEEYKEVDESGTGISTEAFDQVKEMQMQLANQMQAMQDMFLTKFKKLKQKNKILFNKAVENHMQKDQESRSQINELSALAEKEGIDGEPNETRNQPQMQS